jgi:hypothetical protein
VWWLDTIVSEDLPESIFRIEVCGEWTREGYEEEENM